MGLRCCKPQDTWGYQKLKTRKDPGKEGQGPANMLTLNFRMMTLELDSVTGLITY